MKHLSDYTEAAQTELYNKTGAFWAFGSEQLAESKKPGVIYKQFNGGLFVPENEAREFVRGYASLIKNGIDADIKENGLRAIIRRELFNYECFLTCDISDCADALADYPGITRARVLEVYREIKQTEDLSEYY